MSFLRCSSTMLLCLSGVSSWSLQEFSVCVLITTSKWKRSPACLAHAFRGKSSTIMIPRSRIHVNRAKANTCRPADFSLSQCKATVWVFNLICSQARAHTGDESFLCTPFIRIIVWFTQHNSCIKKQGYDVVKLQAAKNLELVYKCRNVICSSSSSWLICEIYSTWLLPCGDNFNWGSQEF